MSETLAADEYLDQAIETTPREERQRHCDEKVKRIVEYAYRHAPAFKERLARVGITPTQITGVRDLEKIPVLRKSEYMELQKQYPPFGGYLTVPPSTMKHIFVSPGPIYDVLPAGETSMRGTRRLYWSAGLRKGDIVINTFTYHMMAAGLSQDVCLTSMGVTVIPAGVGNTDLSVETMHKLGVTAYLGTASFLIRLIERAEELGYAWKQDFALRYAVLTAEPLYPNLRATLEEKYGLRVTDTYGGADFGFLAGECRYKNGFHTSDELIIEIANPTTGKQLGPGEVGEVVVTPFDESFPLIRFGTGDLSSYTEELCRCGRTSNRLTRIMGRVGEGVKIRGVFVYPKHIDEIASQLAVSSYQLLVSRKEHRDEATLKIALSQEGVDEKELTAKIHPLFQELCKIRLDRLEFVGREAIPEGSKKIVDERTTSM